MPPSNDTRRVIVNADDFGLTNGINRGIIEAHERGIVTSASLMVRYPAAKEAAEYAQAHAELSVGLHFEIAEWRYENGAWLAAYQVVDAHDGRAVEEELKRQLALFNDLLGHAPSHLDSHQHVHESTPVREIMLRASEHLQAPLRSCDATVKYCGDFYGQTAEGEPFPTGISVAHLVEIIKGLKIGWTEIGCHPAYADDLDSVYLRERETELRVLCSAEVRATLAARNARLCSFHDYKTKRLQS